MTTKKITYHLNYQKNFFASLSLFQRLSYLKNIFNNKKIMLNIFLNF